VIKLKSADSIFGYAGCLQGHGGRSHRTDHGSPGRHAGRGRQKEHQLKTYLTADLHGFISLQRIGTFCRLFSPAYALNGKEVFIGENP
jgi:hypothetical protein